MDTVNARLAYRFIDWAKKYQIVIKIAYWPVDHARNEMVRDFLKSDCTHLLFIDEDTIPPVDAPQRLLESGKDIISGITPIYSDRGVKMNCFINKDGKEYQVNKNSGIVEISRCGASCLMISRKVLEGMKEPWFKIQYDDTGRPVMSEDLTFCDNAVKLGNQIYCDTSIICNHAKTVLL